MLSLENSKPFKVPLALVYSTTEDAVMRLR
jgi:hypothetical protein